MMQTLARLPCPHLEGAVQKAEMSCTGVRVLGVVESREVAEQPYTFDLSNGGMFAFADVRDAWKDGEGYWLQSFAIVTTVANELMSRIAGWHWHAPLARLHKSL